MNARPSPNTPSDDDALDEAERARDHLRSRATWWEDKKGLVLFPAMTVGLVGGYAIGFVLASGLGLPDLTRWFGAVLGVLAVGRAVAAYFDPRRLTAAQQRVDALRAKRERRRR
jgi:hypothetical protein